MVVVSSFVVVLACVVVYACRVLWVVRAALETARVEIEELKTEATLSAMEIPVLRAQVHDLERALARLQARPLGSPPTKAHRRKARPKSNRKGAATASIEETAKAEDSAPSDQLDLVRSLAANQELAPRKAAA